MSIHGRRVFSLTMACFVFVPTDKGHQVGRGNYSLDDVRSSMRRGIGFLIQGEVSGRLCRNQLFTKGDLPG